MKIQLFPEQNPAGQLSGRSQQSAPHERRWFEIICGILLPVVCVVADPIVFKQSALFGGLGGPLFQWGIVFGYMEILIGVIALTIFLWRRPASPFLAGILLVGTAFSLLLGIILFPFSLLGLFFVIGVLGFSPFLSFIVFARACRQVWNDCLISQTKRRVAAYAGVGVLWASALPISAQITVDAFVKSAVQQILAGEADEKTRELLRVFNWATDLDPLVTAYQEEKEESKKQYLAEMYEEVSGTTIKSRIAILND
jgi:hypothetical protein